MLYEMTGIMVKKFVIIMSCEDGEVVVYEEYDKRKYINLLSEYIREFVEFKLQEYGKADDINKLIENKFYCSRKFTEEIETIANEGSGMKYIDAIVHFCEENNVDIESVPKLLSKPLKEKLKYEAHGTQLTQENISRETSYMIPKVTPFDVYKSYLGLKNHFTKPKYDYHKYCGKSRASLQSFYKRRRQVLL